MDSRDTVNLMSSWLDGCNSKHPECKRRVASSYHPTRPVDIVPLKSLSWTIRINK
ncbi:hypothetical protein CDEST_05318 [Colletotrichum destructivum]|uniref:Uncharacterized protein n=1 Tax=Colletotrichum destructivum TaxID=34406 RepID=A0AAX4IBG7_9PEZI|nr:hypothetical protein CDEST_05318 [Colletotrichum destructivum]